MRARDAIDVGSQQAGLESRRALGRRARLHVMRDDVNIDGRRLDPPIGELLVRPQKRGGEMAQRKGR
eukprot:6193978-Pleurochrysis_carterae.AAC.3